MSGIADPWGAFPLAGRPPSVPTQGGDPWAAFPAVQPPDTPQPVGPDGIDPYTKRPVQGMGMPSSSVVPVEMPADGAAAPGIGTQAAASFAGDVEQKKRIFAAQMFPGMPTEQATRRMFVIDGRLAALGLDNKPVFLDPETPSGMTTGPVRTWRGFGPRNFAQSLAGGVGTIPATAGAIAGGVAASPTSLAAGPAMAAFGAGGGDLVRQYIARMLDPQNTGKNWYNPTPADWSQTAQEAAIGGAGQALGAGVNRLMGASNPLNLRRSDVQRLQAPGALDDAAQAIDAARGQGVPLSLGQATGNPGLIGMEDVAFRTPTVPGGQDIASQFYQGQREALQRAGQNMLGGISPESNKTGAALMFATGASESVPAARRAANAAARPAYEIAEGGGAVRFGDLADRPSVAEALRRAKANQMDAFGRPAQVTVQPLASPSFVDKFGVTEIPGAEAAIRQSPPDVPGFRVWDSVKKSLDDMISEASRKGAHNDARIIGGLRDQLVTRLDDVYPTYPEARALAAPGQRVSRMLESTAAGRSADAGVDERAGAIVAPIFREANPEYVRMAREAFVKSGNENAWNAGIRAHVQDVIDRTSRSVDGLNPAFLRRELIGNTDNREALRAAMTPNQFAGFEKFMDTVSAIARTPAMNSMTAPREVTARVLMEQAEPRAAKIIRGVGAALSPDVLNTFRKIAGSVADGMTQRNAGKMVEMLFDPDGMKMLESMARVPIAQQQSTNVKAQILARALLSGRGESALANGPTAPLLAGQPNQ